MGSVTGNWAIGGGTAPNAGGGYAAYNFNTTSITGNWIIGGGAATNANGGQLGFAPYSITNVDGSWTVGGAAAGAASGGYVSFTPYTGCAVNASMTVNGNAGTSTSTNGRMIFNPSAPLTGSGPFTVNGGTAAGASGGYMECDYQDSGNRTYTAGGGNGTGSTGGLLYFYYQPGVNGTLVANAGTSGGGGGTIYVYGSTTGNVPRLRAFGNGTIDLSGWFVTSASATSIDGTRILNLGSNKLTVGSNNLSTTFSGTIKDGGSYGGAAASLVKVGTGTLTLSGASTYTGGTTVNAGTLLVNSTRGSGTGAGPITVSRSTLGGIGTISGAVTIGSNTGQRAFLSPGTTGIGTLTIKKALKLNATATYNCQLDSNTVTADKVSAKGVTINAASQIALSDLGTGVLTAGTVFTIIDNTANTPIAGAFGNLANGSTVVVGSNTYLVSYTGGTGNDLTLTVQ